MATRDVTIDILARDKTERATQSATRNFETMKRKVEKATDALGDSIGKDLVKKFAPIGAMLTKPLVAGLAAGAPAIAAAIISAASLGVGAALVVVAAIALKENARLKRQFEETSSSIKTSLAKAAEPLVGPFITALKMVEGLVQRLSPHFNAMFRAIAPLVPVMTQAFSGVVEQVVLALRDSMPAVTAAFRGLADALPTVGKWIGEFIRTLLSNPEVIENTTRALALMAAGPLKLLGPLLAGLNVLFGAQVNFVRLYGIIGGELWPKLIAWFDGGTGAVGRLKDAWGPLWTAIQNVWDKLKEFAAAKTDRDIVTKFSALVQSVKGLWGPLKDFLGAIWTEAWAFIKRKWDDTVVPWWTNTVKPWLKREIEGAMDAVFKAASDKAVGWLKSLPGRAWDAVKGIPGRLLGLLGSMSSAGSSIASGFGNSVVSWLSGLPTKAWNAIKGLPSKLGGLAGSMASVGSSIGGAFTKAAVNAIGNAAGRIAGAIRDAISSAKNSLPGPLRAAANALGFAAGDSAWRPAMLAAEFAGSASFAAGSAGRSRTGGPVQVQSTVNVSLDGEPFYDYVATAIQADRQREQWRQKVGKR